MTGMSGAAVSVVLLAAYNGRLQDLEDFLIRHMRFTVKDTLRLRTGEPVGKHLPPTAPGELVLAGAIELTVSRRDYLQWYGDSNNWTLTSDHRRPSILEARILPMNPPLAAFETLSLEPADLDSLQRGCEPGECAIKADAALAAALKSGGGTAQANDDLRQSWLHTAQRYLSEGIAALPGYVDRRRPVRVAEELESVLRASTYLWAASPTAAQYLSQRRSAPPPGFSEFLFWTREQYGFGLKRTAALYHATMSPLGSHATLITTLQLRATHYFEGSLAVTLLVDAGPARAVLIYFNRSRIDALRGGLGSRIRPLIERGAPRAARNELRALRDRLEAWRSHRIAVE